MNTDDKNNLTAFLKNPQQIGAWCLRVELSETTQTAFQSLLNLEGWMFRGGPRYRSRFGYDSYPMDLPPSFLIRLFAYLRACLPKKAQEEFGSLAVSDDSVGIKYGKNWSRARYGSSLNELATPPTRLSPKKKKALSSGVSIFNDHFARFRCSSVPDNSGKIDFLDSNGSRYFQASIEPQGMLKVFSLQENIITRLRELLLSVTSVPLKCEVIRVYSPETLLMDLYVPVLGLLRPGNLVSDVSTIKNLAQINDELREERFVHAIRATGIAVEELLVEIFETYTHEKAPSSPLGELLSTLQVRLKEMVHGSPLKSNSSPTEARKIIGHWIEAEKKAGTATHSAISLAQMLQKSVMPLIEELSKRSAELAKATHREIKIALFPSYVQRCVSELVNLRNRVSHRVERVASSVTNVGYVESALALRAYIVLALWWHAERCLIDYKLTRKEIVEASVARSAALDGGFDP